MARSVWKGPFVEESLMKKVDKYKDDPKTIPIKPWSRKSTILPDFVGVSFQIYNGKKFIPITISEDMFGHNLCEFSPTRTYYGHKPADKKSKPATAAKK
jgi:small subunit ribosomal protein S19